MRHLFLSDNDQIIDLENVIAIEKISADGGKFNCVDYTLVTGKVIRSVHKTEEGAIKEKWAAYEAMKTT